MHRHQPLPSIAHAVIGISDLVTPIVIDILRLLVVAPLRLLWRAVKSARPPQPVTAPHVALLTVPGEFVTAPFVKR